MAQKTFDARVRFKRDTSTNWTNNNPVLLNGEIIIVDTLGGEVRFKIGDGTRTYTQLPFQDEFVRNLIADKADVNHTHDAATYYSSGFMTTSDKAKLDGIEENANNYTHPNYTYRNSGLYKFAVDSLGHVSSTSSVSKSDITALGIPEQDTTYGNASNYSSGLMSVSDYQKLAGIDYNANNYVHPTSAGNKHIPSGGSSGQILRWSSNGTAEWGDEGGGSSPEWAYPPATSRYSMQVANNSNSYTTQRRISTSGIYYVWYEIVLATQVTGQMMSAFIDCQRSYNQLELAMISQATMTGGTAIILSGCFSLEYGDYLRCRVHHTCGQTLTCQWRDSLLLLAST